MYPSNPPNRTHHIVDQPSNVPDAAQFLEVAHAPPIREPCGPHRPVASPPNPHFFAIHSPANPSTPHHKRPHQLSRHRPNHHTPFSFPPFSFLTSTLLDPLFLPRTLSPVASHAPHQYQFPKKLPRCPILLLQ